MVNLSGEQAQFLKYVRETDKAWRRAKDEALERAQEAARSEIAEFAAAREKAVYDAVAVHEIPMSRVGKDGLNTSDPNTPIKIYRNMVSKQERMGVVLAKEIGPRFTLAEIMVRGAGALVVLVLDVDYPRQSTMAGKPVDGWVYKVSWNEGKRQYVADILGLKADEHSNPEVQSWLVKEWAPANYWDEVETEGDDA